MKDRSLRSSSTSVIAALLALRGLPALAGGVSPPPELEQLSALFEKCTWAPPAPTGPPRESIIAVAGKYLEALVSHDANEVPLAPDVCRMPTELIVRASSGPAPKL